MATLDTPHAPHRPTTIDAVLVDDAKGALELDGDRGSEWTASDRFDELDGHDWRITVTVAPDSDSDIRDDACMGEFSRYSYDYMDRDGRDRPAGFDGNAEKIQVDRGSFVWWQPPRGDYALTGPAGRRGTPEFDKFRGQVRDLLEMGYSAVIVKVEYRCQCCGTWAEVGTASLWGIDSLDNGYGREVMAELIDETLADAGIAVIATADVAV